MTTGRVASQDHSIFGKTGPDRGISSLQSVEQLMRPKYSRRKNSRTPRRKIRSPGQRTLGLRLRPVPSQQTLYQRLQPSGSARKVKLIAQQQPLSPINPVPDNATSRVAG